MEEKQSGASVGRLVQLDSLRGFAAIFVVFFHYFYRFHQEDPERIPQAWFLAWGHYGVELFFILSGFVITLTTEKKSDIWSFVKARFFRLYPVFWVAVLFTFASVTLLGPERLKIGLKALLANLTMLPKFLGVTYLDGVYWTLQSEMLFYFFIGVLLLLKLKDRKLEALTGLVCVAILSEFPPLSAMPKSLKIILNLDFIQLFTLGCLIYATRYKGLLPWSVKSILIIALCLISQALHQGWISALVVAGLAVIMYAAVHFHLVVLQNRVLVFLGAISYSLYLVHQNFGLGLISRLMDHGMNFYAAAIIAMLLSILIASILYYAVERPVNAWAKEKVRRAGADEPKSTV